MGTNESKRNILICVVGSPGLVIEVYGEQNCGKGTPDSIVWPVPSSSLVATETGCHLHGGHLTSLNQPQDEEKTFPRTDWALQSLKETKTNCSNALLLH